MAIAIKAENISKQYRLGYVGSGSLKDDAKRWWARMRGKEDPLLTVGETNDRSTKGESDYVWALKDINFEIEQGDTVGIIGRNGAGKSTLLKILSKVTAPTTGNIKVKGRIASLLEVGTGFHGELTGRENIYLNGAIMGMRKHEITRKLDEIVDFAGVERYLDTPVKRYSSGMYVRLGFAVAAHLENEILIVDEVLAVGDAEFQKKCLGKMGDVAKGEGRTVLFVSHQIGSIKNLCKKAISLQSGEIYCAGPTDSVVAEYLNISEPRLDRFFDQSEDDTSEFRIKKLFLTNNSNKETNQFGIDQKIIVNLEYSFKRQDQKVEFALALFNNFGVRVLTIHESLFNKNSILPGTEKIAMELAAKFLTPGSYYFVAVIHIPHIHAYHKIDNVCSFIIIENGSNLSDYDGTDIGVVFPNYSIYKSLE